MFRAMAVIQHEYELGKYAACLHKQYLLFSQEHSDSVRPFLGNSAMRAFAKPFRKTSFDARSVSSILMWLKWFGLKMLLPISSFICDCTGVEAVPGVS